MSLKDYSYEQTRSKLLDILTNVESQLMENKVPHLQIRTRKKENLYLSEEGFWALGTENYTKKTLRTKGGSKQLLKLVHTVVYLLEQLERNKSSTLREFYYNALNWIDEAKFEKINDSNLCLQNLEILLQMIREDFNIYPEAEGKIAGPITIEYRTRSGSTRRVDCTEDVGGNGFLLPRSLKDLKIVSCDAKFLLVIETGGMFSRLIQQNFDKRYSCLLVLTGGHSSRMTRKFIKMMYTDFGLRSAIYTDGDPYGFRIARSIIEGAVKSSHLSQILCSPESVHIGLFPSQIEEYKLPTDSITKLEKQALQSMRNDFRFKDPQLLNQLQMMQTTGKKAEQQALSFYGLTFVTDTYLPKVLKKYGFV